MALWAISLRTRILLFLLVSAALTRVLRRPVALSPQAASGCHDGSPILIGTHHKTGTVLLQHLFKDICPKLGWRCTFNNKPTRCDGPATARRERLHLCLLQHGVRFKLPAAASGERFRFVHVIRDPFEVVLSGYQYAAATSPLVLATLSTRCPARQLPPTPALARAVAQVSPQDDRALGSTAGQEV